MRTGDKEAPLSRSRQEADAILSSRPIVEKHGTAKKCMVATGEWTGDDQITKADTRELESRGEGGHHWKERRARQRTGVINASKFVCFCIPMSVEAPKQTKPSHY